MSTPAHSNAYEQNAFFQPYPESGSEGADDLHTQNRLNDQHPSYLPQPSVTTQPSSLGYTITSPYHYPTTYTTTPTATVYDQRSLAHSNGFPATASETSNNYMNTYSQSQTSYAMSATQQNPQDFQPHCAGGPSSWRDFTGNITSNLEPGAADYMSPASALMQLGRSNGASHQQPDIQLGLDVARNDTLNGTQGQSGWPFYQ